MKIWSKVASWWHNRESQKRIEVYMWEVCQIKVYMAIYGSKQG